MAALSPAAHSALLQFADEVAGVLGESLVAVVLYGGVAKGRFEPLTSELNVLLVVGEEEQGGRLVDTHANVTTPAIWALLEEVLARAPVKGAILERDDRLPPFTELIPELQRGRALGRAHARWP
jgi:hypothetical protein